MSTDTIANYATTEDFINAYVRSDSHLTFKPWLDEKGVYAQWERALLNA